MPKATKRGRKRKEWEEFEERFDGSQLRCRICVEFAKEPEIAWIARSSASNHLKQDGHAANVVELQKQRNQDAVARAAADAQYAAAPEPATHVPAHVRPLSPPSRTREFDINGVAIEMHDFWQDESKDYDDFSCGSDNEESAETRDPAAEERRQTLFEQALAELCIRHGFDSPDDESVPFDPNGADDDSEEVDEAEVKRAVDSMAQSSPWSPYGSKTMFLLDLLDNLPRLRLSSAQLRIMLWIMKETGSKDVPSLYALREVQKKLTASVGVQTRHFRTSLGNIHSANDIGGTIARDWANPELGPLLQVYPEEPDGARREMWHFERLKQLDPSLLSPMYAKGETHFYVNELAQLKNGNFVIPHMWIIRKNEVCADAYPVNITENGFAVGSTLQSICAADLKRNYEQLLRKGHKMRLTDESPCFDMPNPLRKVANGLPIYSSFVSLWADDVSGNRSKQYNKHENICLQHLNIPGRELQQEYNVHFVSTSPHASSLEQFESVHKMIVTSQQEPITTLHVGKDSRYLCKIRLVPVCLPADNPQQSVEASHIGPGGNRICRCCNVGGPDKVTETDDGYESLFQEGTSRSRDSVRSEIEAQLRAAMSGIETSVTSKQTESGVKDRIAQHWIDQMITLARKLTKEKVPDEEIVDKLSAWLAEQTSKPYNVLLNMDGLDPTQDTPVELLHTVLLGVVKYAWHGFHSQWKAGAGETFVARLQSTDTLGLSIEPIQAPYIVQYKNNLIGRHFKALMQTTTFHVHGITTDESFHLFKCIGALGAILWMPEIDDMEQYLNDVQVLIDNVLDAFVAIEPRKIIVKQKLHVLLHLVRDIRRFGPAFRFSTEIFESFNTVFRASSILSNHQAPSRDIAKKLASLERVKHIVSGGYWPTSKEWETFERAGDNIRAYLDSHPIVLRHLGWARPGSVRLGQVKLPGKRSRITVPWGGTQASKNEHLTILDPAGTAAPWTHCTNVAIVSTDRCTIGSWICIAKNSTDTIFGRVVEIVSSAGQSAVLICVERHRLGSTKHAHFDMPTLVRCDPREFLVVQPKDALFALNVQHDCFSAKCATSNIDTTVHQERQEVVKQLLTLTHVDDGRFVINTHALHNSHLLRRALPRSLTAPLHVIADRADFHATLAQDVRDAHDAARQKRQAANKQGPAAADAATVPPPATTAAGTSEEATESGGMSVDT